MFKVGGHDGSTLAAAREVASDVSFVDTPVALAWSGGRFAVIYNHKRPDLKQSARLLDRDGKPVGVAVVVPGCLLTARLPAAAWAGDTLAVLFEGGKSGLPDRRICATVFACR